MEEDEIFELSNEFFSFLEKNSKKELDSIKLKITESVREFQKNKNIDDKDIRTIIRQLVQDYSDGDSCVLSIFEYIFVKTFNKKKISL